MAGGETGARAGGLYDRPAFGADEQLDAGGQWRDLPAGRSRSHDNGVCRQKLLPSVTITTASRAQSYAIHPVLWLGGLLALLGLSIGAISAGLYMAYHDAIIELAISRPIRMEQAYEDRIAALRSEIDRVNSRQLLDQDAFEAKIGQLMARQETLRAAETRVAGLLSRARDQNLRVGSEQRTTTGFSGQLGGNLAAPTLAQPNPQMQEAPRPIENTPLRSSWLSNFYRSQSGADFGTRSTPALKLARVEAEIDQMKAAELQSVAAVTGLAEANARAIERVVGRLGLHVAGAEQQASATGALPAEPMPAGSAVRGVGGPLVPILDEGETLTRAEAALTRLNQLTAGLLGLPLGTPMTGPIEVTSPFGERADPFLGVPAMHTGVDFRASYGAPVEATGAGVVTEASRQGGYGNMVEIDHGSGLQSRYGHLSQFAVVVGQKVKPGQIVGYVGSTGRSTAAHLHYETRVGGVAVNPESYLQAGNQLRPLLN